MSTASKLRELFTNGYHRIGQIEIQTDVLSIRYTLCHADDVERSRQPDYGELELHRGPADARDLSTYSEDG